jgi:uncharacterized protein YegP (UPF0339 family)
MRLLLIAVVLMANLLPASAATSNRWYLRYDTDNGPEARVYRSKAACEAGIRDLKKRSASIKKIHDSIGEKEFKRLNPFSSNKAYFRNPRCSNRLPYGFLPPS